MNVTVKYNLTQAGQKAALIAGKTATASVTESMTFDDATLIDKLTINPDGTMGLNAEGRKAYGDKTLYLDAPPVDLAALLVMLDAHTEANRDMHMAESREAAEKKAADAKTTQDIGTNQHAWSGPIDAREMSAPEGAKRVFTRTQDRAKHGNRPYLRWSLSGSIKVDGHEYRGHFVFLVDERCLGSDGQVHGEVIWTGKDWRIHVWKRLPVNYSTATWREPVKLEIHADSGFQGSFSDAPASHAVKSQPA